MYQSKFGNNVAKRADFVHFYLSQVWLEISVCWWLLQFHEILKAVNISKDKFWNISQIVLTFRLEEHAESEKNIPNHWYNDLEAATKYSKVLRILCVMILQMKSLQSCIFLKELALPFFAGCYESTARRSRICSVEVCVERCKCTEWATATADGTSAGGAKAAGEQTAGHCNQREGGTAGTHCKT